MIFVVYVLVILSEDNPSLFIHFAKKGLNPLNYCPWYVEYRLGISPYEVFKKFLQLIK